MIVADKNGSIFAEIDGWVVSRGGLGGISWGLGGMLGGISQNRETVDTPRLEPFGWYMWYLAGTTPPQECKFTFFLYLRIYLYQPLTIRIYILLRLIIYNYSPPSVL